MPLFRVYKRVFGELEAGRKTIEVRTRLLRGKTAVFLCGRKVVRKGIAGVTPFDLGGDFFRENWNKIIPFASSLDEAKSAILSIFPDATHFYAYLLK